MVNTNKRYNNMTKDETKKTLAWAEVFITNKKIQLKIALAGEERINNTQTRFITKDNYT